jgi:hypothetical protein
MDPDHLIVRLCAEAMRAEIEGRLADARALLDEAWVQRQNDYDACIAAHFLARHQRTPAEMLFWNQAALDHALAARAMPGSEELVCAFFPSLYLNLGYAHEMSGSLVEARACYRLALEHSGRLDSGAYGDTVRTGILEGLRRTQAADAG